jgi:AbrB family looped-hinge helix DNA binding protein
VELKARVTSKGQLTIPKEVRKALGVREGDSLLFEINDDSGEVTMRVARKPVSFADYAGVWREGGDEGSGGMSVEEVNAYVREIRGHDGA